LRFLTKIRVIFLVALALRLYSLAGYVEPRPKQALGAIPFLFEPGNIAFSLASGHGFASPFRVDTGPTAWMTPVYPGILAGIFRVFGIYTYDAFLAAALLNVIFSTLTCIPLYFAGKRIGGLALAAIATWLWAIFPQAITLPYEALWDASMAAFLAATILWATLEVARSEKILDWIGFGLLWGFAIMTTAALGAALPFLLLWTDGKRRALLAGAVAVLCCVPWTVRNYMTFHALVPLRTVMGLSLWLGNNEHADGTSTSNLHPISNSTERTQFAEEGEIAYNGRKQNEAIRYMLGHPARTLQLSGRRFVAIWSGGSVHPIDEFIHTRLLWTRWVLAFNLFAAFAGAAGIAILFRTSNPYAYPAAVFPVVYPLAYYFTLAPPRYVHPADPALLLLAAVTLRAICQTVYNR